MKLCQQMIHVAYTTHAGGLTSMKNVYFTEIPWIIQLDGRNRSSIFRSRWYGASSIDLVQEKECVLATDEMVHDCNHIDMGNK